MVHRSVLNHLSSFTHHHDGSIISSGAVTMVFSLLALSAPPWHLTEVRAVCRMVLFFVWRFRRGGALSGSFSRARRRQWLVLAGNDGSLLPGLLALCLMPQPSEQGADGFASVRSSLTCGSPVLVLSKFSVLDSRHLKGPWSCLRWQWCSRWDVV